MSSPKFDDGPWIGGLLRLAWERVRERIDSGIRVAGYDDLNPAHLALFRYDSFDGQRPTAIANQMRITKQSLNDLLRHLENGGYVELVPDPSDSRARLMRLTSRGRQLDSVVRVHARNAEQELVSALGKGRFETLRETLRAITDQRVTHSRDSGNDAALAHRGDWRRGHWRQGRQTGNGPVHRKRADGKP